MATLLLAFLFMTVEWDALMKDARSNYAKGEYTLARQALDQVRTQLGNLPPKDSKRYDLYRLSADVLSALGETEAAESAFLEAINFRENALGMNHSLVADDLTALAMLIHTKPDVARALVILQRVQQIHFTEGGPSAPALADDYSRMALLYMDQGNAGRASSMLELALSIRGETLGDWHPALLPEMDRLGVAFVTDRKYERAETIYRRALILRERLFGKNSPELIQNVEGLAYALFGEKKYDDAELFYKRLLSLWESSAGIAHPMAAITLDKLAVLYREQKKFAEGQQASDTAIAFKAHFLASGLVREAGVQMGRSNSLEATILYKRAIAVLDAKRPEHADLIKQVKEMLDFLIPKPPAKKK